MMNAVRSRRMVMALLTTGIAAAGTLPGGPVSGQSPESAAAVRHPYGLSVKVGLEPQLVVSFGYVHQFNGDEASGAGIGMAVKFPPYQLGSGSGRLGVVTTAHRISSGGWGSSASSEVYVARGKNRAGTIHGLGLKVRANPGRYGQSWGIAADLAWQGTLLTHIRHSAGTAETFDGRYPEDEGAFRVPVTGWYASTAHRFRAGLAGTRTLSDDRLLKVSIGSVFSLQNQGILLGFAHGQVPAYVEASLHFGR